MKERTHLAEELESKLAAALEIADSCHPGELDPAKVADLKAILGKQRGIACELGSHVGHLRRDIRSQRDLLRRLRARRDYPHNEILVCRKKLDVLEAQLDRWRVIRIRIEGHINILHKTLRDLEKFLKTGGVPIVD